MIERQHIPCQYIPLVETSDEIFPTLFQSFDIGTVLLSCAVGIWSVDVVSLLCIEGVSKASCRTDSESTLPSDSASLDTMDDGASSVTKRCILFLC